MVNRFMLASACQDRYDFKIITIQFHPMKNTPKIANNCSHVTHRNASELCQSKHVKRRPTEDERADEHKAHRGHFVFSVGRFSCWLFHRFPQPLHRSTEVVCSIRNHHCHRRWRRLSLPPWLRLTDTADDQSVEHRHDLCRRF